MAVTPEKIKDHLVICEILGCHEASEGITDIQVDDGRLWVYDNYRNKWLSSDRLTAIAGKNGRAKNLYLRLPSGQPSNLTGYRIPRAATITAISAQTKENETWILRIRKNDSVANILSLALNNTNGKHDITVDVDLDEGDRIQFYADTTAFLGIRDPFAWIEIAWRNDNL